MTTMCSRKAKREMARRTPTPFVAGNVAPAGGREPEPKDALPDVRDGLTRKERVVLYVLHAAQKERGDRNVPTAMLWGRVCEHFYISPEELSALLARLGARN